MKPYTQELIGYYERQGLDRPAARRQGMTVTLLMSGLDSSLPSEGDLEDMTWHYNQSVAGEARRTYLDQRRMFGMGNKQVGRSALTSVMQSETEARLSPVDHYYAAADLSVEPPTQPASLEATWDARYRNLSWLQRRSPRVVAGAVYTCAWLETARQIPQEHRAILNPSLVQKPHP
jgi:hypothetical protein